MNVTRTTNDNGTFRYEIDGELQTKASKVFYTHVSTYTNGAVLFHKTESAARKAKGYAGWVKVGYQAIEDADPFPTADELTWHEVPGESRAHDARGNLVIHITVNGANQWTWAISRRGPVAHGTRRPDLDTAKTEALAALATL